MAQHLPESGTIGLGMARSQWNDNGPNPVTSISLGGSQCRSFAQKPNGAVKMSDLYARYRGYKMQFFSYPVTCRIDVDDSYDGDGGISQPAHSIGGSFIGIGAFRRQVVNCLFPFHDIPTHTINLGNITPQKFGNVSLMFIGYTRTCSTWYNRTWDSMGISVQIDGLPDPVIESGNSHAVTDNRYPLNLSMTYRRNGSSLKSITFRKVCHQPSNGGNYMVSEPWYFGRQYTGQYSGANSTWTLRELGNLGLTCNQAGQPGGNKMWLVSYYYGGREPFNVGDQVEIVDISYWW